MSGPGGLAVPSGVDLNALMQMVVEAEAEGGAAQQGAEAARAAPEAPATGGEALGCPALAYEHKMETPELAAFTQRAVHIAGPDRRIIVTMATGGYVDFARSWARGLDAVNVSHYVIAALDDVALAELSMLGDHVVPVYDEAMADDAPGRDEPAAYGPGALRALTQI